MVYERVIEQLQAFVLSDGDDPITSSDAFSKGFRVRRPALEGWTK